MAGDSGVPEEKERQAILDHSTQASLCWTKKSPCSALVCVKCRKSSSWSLPNDWVMYSWSVFRLPYHDSSLIAVSNPPSSNTQRRAVIHRLPSKRSHAASLSLRT